MLLDQHLTTLSVRKSVCRSIHSISYLLDAHFLSGLSLPPMNRCETALDGVRVTSHSGSSLLIIGDYVVSPSLVEFSRFLISCCRPHHQCIAHSHASMTPTSFHHQCAHRPHRPQALSPSHQATIISIRVLS